MALIMYIMLLWQEQALLEVCVLKQKWQCNRLCHVFAKCCNMIIITAVR